MKFFSAQIACITIIAIAVAACDGSGNGESSTVTASPQTNAQKFGYAIGHDLGITLLRVRSRVDVAAVKRGIDDGLSDRPVKMDEDERQAIKNKIATAMVSMAAERQSPRPSSVADEVEQLPHKFPAFSNDYTCRLIYENLTVIAKMHTSDDIKRTMIDSTLRKPDVRKCLY